MQITEKLEMGAKSGVLRLSVPVGGVCVPTRRPWIGDGVAVFCWDSWGR